MNPDTKNTDWFPQEDPEWLEAAIARIRADIESRTPHDDTVPDYAVGEWYLNHRIITGEELRGVYRRMNRRGEYTTDVPIGRGAPTTLNVIRGGKA